MKGLLKRFWIKHPAVAQPVGPLRWLAFTVGEWMQSVGRRLSRWAIDPGDESPF